MELIETGIEGCHEIVYKSFHDQRGSFTKTFHQPAFEALGLRTDWREEYYSVSERNVLRGMHFQTPPCDHAKMVYCLQGEVLDVVVDLRLGSPTYGRCASLVLSRQKGNGIYIPSGMAHGFLSLSERSVMHYKVTSVHSAEHDAGILWNSFGFEWPVDTPILSSRDEQHPRLADFDSSFPYQARG